MLKSSNLKSLLEAEVTVDGSNGTMQLNTQQIATQATSHLNYDKNTTSTTKATKLSGEADNGIITATAKPCLIKEQNDTSLAALKLSDGFLRIFEPPLVRVRGQLKELIGKQNKIYIDLSAEKFKLDNAEITKLQEMMNNVKVYREKLIKIKKQMQGIYQRTKVMKKRAFNIQSCKQKELQRKLQKQQHEESLINKNI